MALLNGCRVVPAVPVVPPTEVPSESEREFHALVLSKEPALRRGVIRAFRLLGRRLKPEEVAEHLQNAYCRLFQARERGVGVWRERESQPCDSYFLRLAERSVYDHLRRSLAAKRRPPLPPLSLEEVSRGAALIDPAPSPEAAFLVREQRKVSWQNLLAAGGLVGRDSEKMVALALSGQGSREIAAALDHRVKPSSIDTLLSRFRRRLAEQGIVLPHRRRARVPMGIESAAPPVPFDGRSFRKKRFAQGSPTDH